jgi:hypothetical protein
MTRRLPRKYAKAAADAEGNEAVRYRYGAVES